MMQILDAHRGHTRDKHYSLEDHRDDLVLAKALVQHVLGDTVPFPTSLAIGVWKVEVETLDDQDIDHHTTLEETLEEKLENWERGRLLARKTPHSYQ
eukprot:5778727-Amphidinium_carterae.1